MLTTYKVKLDVFEGPLDLLLFLIRQEEVSIQDIPIASVTKQYLEYIQLMRLLDLDVAGDFIVMASTLIRIKARMLLPQSPAEESEEAGDPRTELVQNLLEYQEYKKLAEALDERQNTQRDIFYRFMPPEQIIGSDDDQLLEVSLFDLLAAFKEAMDAAPEEVVHQVQRLAISVDERITFLIEYLQEKKRVQFFDMFPKGTVKLVLVVTFVALLELIKRQSVRIGQSQAFGDIWLYWHEGGEMPEEAVSTAAEAPPPPVPTPLPADPAAEPDDECGLDDDLAEVAATESAAASVVTESEPAPPPAIDQNPDDQPAATDTTGPVVQVEPVAPENITPTQPPAPEAETAPAGPVIQTNPENH